jgi:hypothetical protein
MIDANTIIQPDILFKRGVIIIAGDDRPDLSLLARQTAVELATGDKWIQMFPATQRRVLYLNLRQWYSPIHYKAFDKIAGNKLGLIYLNQPSMSLHTETGTNKLAKIIQSYKPEVVVIEYLSDTVPTILGPKLKLVMINLRKIAKQYGACFILLHELVKGNWKSKPVRASDLRGDYIIAYEADSIIALTADKGDVRKLHMVKVDFSPIEISTPILLEYRPELEMPFTPSDKFYRRVSSDR